MTRQHNKNKSKRVVRKTTLIYCEGMCDEIFVKHLKSLYLDREKIAVTVTSGNGGYPVKLVNDAITSIEAFDRRCVVLDNDRASQEMEKARIIAKKSDICLIENTPCLEALLLSILKDGKNFNTKSSKWCKSQFQMGYITESKRRSTQEYENVFPKSLLDEMRVKVENLNKLLRILENGYY